MFEGNELLCGKEGSGIWMMNMGFARQEGGYRCVFYVIGALRVFGNDS